MAEAEYNNVEVKLVQSKKKNAIALKQNYF